MYDERVACVSIEHNGAVGLVVAETMEIDQGLSPYITGLEPWQYDVSGGFTLRGYFTPPTGKPVIHFLHGNGFNGLIYEKFLAPLQKHFDFFISNAQGHGGSDAGGRFDNWDASADYFSEVWQHYERLWAGVPKIGLGHSFGAVNTLLMTRLSPNAFDRIVLLDPIVGSSAWTVLANAFSFLGLSSQLPMVKQAKVRGTQWENAEAAWAYFYQRGTFKDWDDDCLHSYIRHALKADSEGRLNLICPPQIEADIFASYSTHVRSAIRALSIPAKVYYGEKTYDFVQKELMRVDQKHQNFDVEKLSGGHCFMLQNPHQTAQKVLNYLLSP